MPAVGRRTGNMVRIPKEATDYKKRHPNRLNEDGSITINDTTWKVGGKFDHLCLRRGNSSWGKMFRNAIIKDIRPDLQEEGLTEIDISGTSDWEKCEATCLLAEIV